MKSFLTYLIPFLLFSCAQETSVPPVTSGEELVSPSLSVENINNTMENSSPSQDTRRFEDPSVVSDEQLSNYYIEIDCSIDGEPIGTMVFDLWASEAPIAVRNFLRYADEGLYDNKTYHRILRDFMIQGGSPDNTAAGKGQYGNVKAEFSKDKIRQHRYGTLSMARGGNPDSASSQYFIVTDSYNPSVRNLDGQYTSFGQLVKGVDVLEAIADIPVEPNKMSGEPSSPLKRAEVTQCRVVEGSTPKFDEIVRRPLPDIGDEPEQIKIQHVLISFAGTRTEATRTKEDAEKLAMDILARAQAGEDFDALVMQYTDDPGGKSTEPRGSYSMMNTGRRNVEADEASAVIQKEAEAIQQGLIARVQSKEITMEEAQAEFRKITEPLVLKLSAIQWFPREQMVPGFGNIGFKLKVGEVGISNYHQTDSPFGWHIIKRYE